RTALDVVIVLAAIVSVVVYAVAALKSPRPRATPFVAAPVVAWVLMLVGVPLVAWVRLPSNLPHPGSCFSRRCFPRSAAVRSSGGVSALLRSRARHTRSWP